MPVYSLGWRTPGLMLAYWGLLEFTHIMVVATTCTGNDIDGLRGSVIVPGALLWIAIGFHARSVLRARRPDGSVRHASALSDLGTAALAAWVLMLCARQLWTAGALILVAARGYHFCDYLEEANSYLPAWGWSLERSLAAPHTDIDAVAWLSVMHLVASAMLIGGLCAVALVALVAAFADRSRPS